MKASIILLVILIAFLFSLDFKSISMTYNHTAKVLRTYSTSLLVKENGMKYYLLGVDGDFMKGDVINFNCFYTTSTSSQDSFDIYFRSLGADAYGYIKDVSIVKSEHSMRNNLFKSFINDTDSYSQNVLALLYGYRTQFNGHMLDQVYKMGTAHLFVISGFHITIFFILVEKVCQKITNKGYISSYGSIFIVSVFLWFIYFPLTAVRALITISLIRTHRLNRIESLSLCGLIFYSLNPFIMITNSMMLSFGITYIIYIFNPRKKMFTDTIIITVVSFYASMPTIASWQDTVNLLAPILVIFFTPIVSFSYIFALVLLPFHYLWWIGDLYFFLFDISISLASNIYIPLSFREIDIYRQYYLSALTVIYIYSMREQKIILLNSLITLSVLFYII